MIHVNNRFFFQNVNYLDGEIKFDFKKKRFMLLIIPH